MPLMLADFAWALGLGVYLDVHATHPSRVIQSEVITMAVETMKSPIPMTANQTRSFLFTDK